MFRLQGCMKHTVTHNLFQHILQTRFDKMQTSVVGFVYHFWINVNPYHLNAMFGSDNRSGQSNIAQPHKTSFHLQ